ncbi:MAG: HD domain-containing protein [Candidatus Diapherotrites archaeon]
MASADVEGLDRKNNLGELAKSRPEMDVALLERAYDFGCLKLSGIMDLRDKPLMLHNFEVAKILVSVNADSTTVAAAMVHNVLSHGASKKEISESVGGEVANIVAELDKFMFSYLSGNMEQGTDQTKKIILAMTKDLRLVLIQLADIVHNMRWFEVIPKESQKILLEETDQIYAPLAHKLGVQRIKAELEDLWLKNSKPDVFNRLQKKIKGGERERMREITKVKSILEKKLKEKKISVTIEGRAKHVYGIYNKMQRKNSSFEEIYDLIAVRVITGSVEECYEILGIIHSIWKPLPGEFDDYIAKPKSNLYQSLHTAVIGPGRKPIEIQIRTKEMHQISEFGAAGHWLYKGRAKEDKYDRKLTWLRELLEWRKGSKNNEKDSLKVDFFESDIFTLTPKGEVVELQTGATALDFAYAVHSDIGNHCQQARVNGKAVALNHELDNGDLVEIITSAKQQPKTSWLGFVKTSKAKNKIRQKLHLGVKKPGVKEKHIKAITIKKHDSKVKLAKCCSPVPGDEITGFITTKRKISVHRADCEELEKENIKKGVKVDWGIGVKGDYAVELRVRGEERVGLLSDLLSVFSKNGIFVTSANAKSVKTGYANCKFGLKIKDLKHLEKVVSELRSVKGILEVSR